MTGPAPLGVTTTYAGTGFTAIVGNHTLVLLAVAPDSDLVRALWPLVSQDAGWDAVVSALFTTGVADLPPMCLLHRESETTNVLVRGAITTRIEIDGQPDETVSGERVTTWIERPFDHVTGAELGVCVADGRSATQLPLLGGVVRAGNLRRTWTEVGMSAPPPSGDVAPPPPRNFPPPPPNDVPTPLTDHVPAWPQLDDVVAAPLTPEPAPEPPPVPARPADPMPMPVEDPPPRSDRPGPRLGAIDWGVGRSRPGELPLPVFDAAPDVAEAEKPITGSMLDGDHDSHTRPSSRPHMPRVRAERTVLQINAVRCPDGHINPPFGERCRICNRLLDDDQAAFEITQPVVGRLRLLPGDATFPLRGRVLIGREPRLEGRDTTLNDSSNLADVALLPVDSPERSISRTHAEIRVVGWTVEVIDLSSTYTEVTNPGGQPVRLRRGNPAVILPGAEIVLADEVTLRYEVTE